MSDDPTKVSESVAENGGGKTSGDEVVHICLTPGCGKPATMSCPTCIKSGLPPSRFCTQDCFKSSWNEHKKLHPVVKKPKDPLSMPPEFKYYTFTGPLRPCQVTPQKSVPSHIPRPDYADHPEGKSMSEQMDKQTNTTIKKYTAEEIEGIRAACRIGREVLDIAGRAVRVGVRCDEIDNIVHEETIKRGAYPSPLNYYKFPKSVCTSVNEIICHGIPDMRELQNGDIVNIDISVYYNGFHGDLNETFLVGDVDEDSYELVKCAYDSLAAAVACVRPGFLYRDLGERINRVTKAAKCSIVKTYCGHGIGHLFHTAPNVPHYPDNKAKGTMEVGHVFTIEPMINRGTFRDVLWPDNWTAATADGKRSAQFEHTLVVTETGCELLTGRVGEPTDRMVWKREFFQR